MHSCGANQGELYKVVASLTNSDKKLVLPSAIPPNELPDTFTDYFTDKIAEIRATFDTSASLSGTVLEDVNPVDELGEFHPTSDRRRSYQST